MLASNSDFSYDRWIAKRRYETLDAGIDGAAMDSRVLTLLNAYKAINTLWFEIINGRKPVRNTVTLGWINFDQEFELLLYRVMPVKQGYTWHDGALPLAARKHRVDPEIAASKRAAVTKHREGKL